MQITTRWVGTEDWAIRGAAGSTISCFPDPFCKLALKDYRHPHERRTCSFKLTYDWPSRTHLELCFPPCEATRSHQSVTRKRNLTGTRPCQHPDRRLPASRTVRNKFLLLMSKKVKEEGRRREGEGKKAFVVRQGRFYYSLQRRRAYIMGTDGVSQ